jgi:multicomponent Na+:H+ antiporter subunit F
MIGLVSDIALVLLAAAIVMTLFRIVRGPTLADRIVALDLLSLLGVAAIGAFAFRVGISVYVTIAVVLCAVGFVATVAFARYLVGKPRP